MPCPCPDKEPNVFELLILLKINPWGHYSRASGDSTLSYAMWATLYLWSWGWRWRPPTSERRWRAPRGRGSCGRRRRSRRSGTRRSRRGGRRRASGRSCPPSPAPEPPGAPAQVVAPADHPARAHARHLHLRERRHVRSAGLCVSNMHVHKWTQPLQRVLSTSKTITITRSQPIENGGLNRSLEQTLHTHTSIWLTHHQTKPTSTPPAPAATASPGREPLFSHWTSRPEVPPPGSPDTWQVRVSGDPACRLTRPLGVDVTVMDSARRETNNRRAQSEWGEQGHWEINDVIQVRYRHCMTHWWMRAASTW